MGSGWKIHLSYTAEMIKWDSIPTQLFIVCLFVFYYPRTTKFAHVSDIPTEGVKLHTWRKRERLFILMGSFRDFKKDDWLLDAVLT